MLRVRVLKTIGRLIFLALLLATTLGPWFADSHPATQEECYRPPLPGLSPLVWLGNGYCACLITLKGHVEYGLLYGREVNWLLCLPVALPVLSTLLILLFGERRWLWVGHLAAWGLLAVLALLWFGVILYGHEGVLILWGAGLSGMVAVAILAGEVVYAKMPNQRKLPNTQKHK